MRLFIEPNESLLFRTGRPFVAGENNFAETLFPPTPETLQGAVRAFIASYWEPGLTVAEAFQETNLPDLIGNREGYGRFRITGISLGRRTDSNGKSIERLFPAPAHILQVEDDEETQVRLGLRSRQEEQIATNLPEDMDLLYPEKVSDDVEKLEPIKGWLLESELEKALSSDTQAQKVKVTKDHEIYTRESRLGIGMDNKTKATQEGLLYQVEMIRMKPHYGFVVDIALVSEQNKDEFIDDEKIRELLHLPLSGWMTIGGERRAACFEVVKSPASSSLEQNAEGNMLYLATPSAFNFGWQSQDWAKIGIEEKPVAVAIERYQPIGGWSLIPGSNGGNDKPLRRCVPAGTIYFFRNDIHIPSSFTDNGKEIGYGIAYVGHTGVK